MVFRAGLRHLTRHAWQAGLSIVGIAVGVAVVVAIDLANESARRAFELSTEAVAGRATHEVVGGPGSQTAAHACDGKGIDYIDACFGQ